MSITDIKLKMFMLFFLSTSQEFCEFQKLQKEIHALCVSFICPHAMRWYRFQTDMHYEVIRTEEASIVKSFFLFIFTVSQVILCPGPFNFLLLMSLSLISALSNVSIWALHLHFPPIKPTTRPTNHGLWGVLYLLYFSFIIYKIKIPQICYVFYKYSMA